MKLSATWRRVRAVIMKEYKHVRFDPGYLFLTIFSPAVLLTLLAYIFSFNINKANVVMIDHDQSPQSHAYVRSLTANNDLTVVATASRYEEAIEFFKSGEAEAVVIIPPDFGSKLSAREAAPVNVIVDGSDPTVGSQVIAAIEQRSATYSAAIMGLGSGGFEVRHRVWFNANLDSQYSMIPGLMAIVLILPAMSVALGVTREKETGTFETLVTTPILGKEFLLGKLFVYLSLGLVGALLALAVAVFWFGVPFRGNLPFYLFVTGVYLFAVMSFCLIVAHFVISQRTATTIVLLAMFIPSFFLTGLITQVDRTSTGSYIASQLLPSTHFIVISRGVMLKASTINQLAIEIGILLAMGGAATLLSVMLFRKKLSTS